MDESMKRTEQTETDLEANRKKNTRSKLNKNKSNMKGVWDIIWQIHNNDKGKPAQEKSKPSNWLIICDK